MNPQYETLYVPPIKVKVEVIAQKGTRNNITGGPETGAPLTPSVEDDYPEVVHDSSKCVHSNNSTPPPPHRHPLACMRRIPILVSLDGCSLWTCTNVRVSQGAAGVYNLSFQQGRLLHIIQTNCGTLYSKT